MKAKKETTDRFPTWWLFYYVLRKAYFFLGIPFFLFCALGFTEMLCSDRYFGNKVEDYVVTFGSWFLLLAPGIWMYSRAKTRREKIRKVVQTIKESGFYYTLSFTIIIKIFMYKVWSQTEHSSQLHPIQYVQRYTFLLILPNFNPSILLIH